MPNVPLTIRNIDVYHARAGDHFNLKSWSGRGGKSYSVSVVSGELGSSKGKFY